MGGTPAQLAFAHDADCASLASVGTRSLPMSAAPSVNPSRRAQKDSQRAALYASATSGPDEMRQSRVMALLEEKKRRREEEARKAAGLPPLPSLTPAREVEPEIAITKVAPPPVALAAANADRSSQKKKKREHEGSSDDSSDSESESSGARRKRKKERKERRKKKEKKKKHKHKSKPREDH